MTEKRKRSGRPTTAAQPGKKATLGIRATPELKERLDREAKKNDRSLSQEAEFRLERSFEEDRRIEETFGDPRLYALWQMVSSALVFRQRLRHGMNEEPKWFENAVDFDSMVAGVVKVLQSVRPPEPGSDDPHNWNRAIVNATGETIASEVLPKIAASPNPRLGDLTPRLREHVEEMQRRQNKLRRTVTGGRKK